MFNAPSFNLTDLFWAFVDLLTGNWFYLALFTATVGFLITRSLYALYVWMQGRAVQRANYLAVQDELRTLQRELDAEDRARMGTVIAISDRRRNGAA